MLYSIIKFLAGLGLRIFFRKRILPPQAWLDAQGPVIIASNHPNSMMDAILIGTNCRRPVHFLIRSDMFQRPLFRWFLQQLNGIPVYRQSEEKEKIRQNRASFEQCRDVLLQNGVVLIFAEGVTELDWKLKPLKSGTSRLVSFCLEDPYLKENLKLVPVGLCYNHYKRFSRTVFIQAAPPIIPGEIAGLDTEGRWRKNFNESLRAAMLPLAPQMPSSRKEHVSMWSVLVGMAAESSACGKPGLEKLANAGERLPHTEPQKIQAYAGMHYPFLPPDRQAEYIFLGAATLLLLPALAGLVLNGPFYFPLRAWCNRKTKGTIFYDSLFFSLLIVLYPLYVLLMALLLGYMLPRTWMLWFLIIPLSGWMTARAWLYAKALINFYSLETEARKLPLTLLNNTQ